MRSDRQPSRPSLDSERGTISPKRIRLVIADDHQGFLEEVGFFLAAEFDVLSAVRDGASLVRAASELRPDLIVTDIDMPNLSGPEASREILRRGNARGAVALTVCNQPEVVRKCRESGILGYVLKVDAGDELVAAVKCVSRGGEYESRGVRKNAV